MKKIKKLIGIVIILVFAFGYAHIAKMNIIYDKNVDNSEYLDMGDLNGKKVEQRFVCKEDTLDGVYAKCQILGDVLDTKVHYTITDEQEEKVVAQGSLSADGIKNAKFNKFTFETIENCRGKELVLAIWSEASAEGNGVTFYFQPETEEDTQLVIGGNETQGTMIMKTITNRFDLETFCVLLLFVGFIVGFMKVLYKLFK